MAGSSDRRRRAKDSLSDPQNGRTLLDGDLEVPRHAHGELDYAGVVGTNRCPKFR